VTASLFHQCATRLSFSQGPKRQPDVPVKFVHSPTNRRPTGEKAEAESAGREAPREEAGDGQGQGTRSIPPPPPAFPVLN
jgi:hypothetical protein